MRAIWCSISRRLRSGGATPAPDLWPRIAADRPERDGPTLPWRDPLSITTSAIGLVLLAGVIGLVVLAPDQGRHSVGTDQMSTSPDDTSLRAPSYFRLLPSPAYAQAGARSALPPVTSVDPSKFRNGRWSYEAWMIFEGERQPVSEWDTTTVARTQLGEEPAIALVSSSVRRAGIMVRYRDSLYLRSVDGRGMRRVSLYSWGETVPTRIEITFDRDTVRGRWRGPRREKNWTALVPPSGSGALPHAPFEILSALPLAAGWAAKVDMIGGHPSSRDSTVVDIYTFEVRVTGREPVTVAAGQFDCWRVELGTPTMGETSIWGVTLWVDVDSKQIIRLRSRERDGVIQERQLVAVNLPR